MKATILIQGIGLIYHKDDGLWKVLFPFEECHTVKFKESFSDPGISLAGLTSQVRIKTVNPTSSFEVGDFDDVLDLTADRAHQEGVNLKDNPAPFVLLTVENAHFTIMHSTFCRYHLIDGLGPISKLKQIAYTVKGNIECDSLIVEADGVSGFPKKFDQNIDLIFNNECPPGSSGSVSDLRLLYDVIKDARNNDLKLTIERDPEQKPQATPTSPILSVLSRADNNCRPGEEGLPCNVFKATKPGNLP